MDEARIQEQQEQSGRLPLPEYVGWSTFPFEGDMRVKAVADLEIPEPPRHGAGGVDCGSCARPDSDYVWADADWRVSAGKSPTGLPAVLILEPRAHHDLGDLPPELLASLGTMIWRVDRALASLDGVVRVQLARWGDGAEHLHLWFLPRPEGFVQGRGSFLAHWDDILAPRPVEEWQATLAQVRSSLVASDEETLGRGAGASG